MRLTQLRIDRGRYFLAGALLFALKFGVDRFVARQFFGRGWSPLNYLVPNETYSIASLPPDERYVYLVMLGVALPFALTGLVLTIARVRDAKLSPVWAVLFFLPVINLLFFALLSLITTARPDRAPDPSTIDETTAASDAAIPQATLAAPPRPMAPPIDYRTPYVTAAARAPRTPLGRIAFMFSALGSALASGLLAPVFISIGVVWLRNYGWGLFVGVPFLVGLVAALLHSVVRPRTIGECIAVGVSGGVVGIISSIAFALEGIGCLIMFLPMALPLTVLGAAVGYSIQLARHGETFQTMAAMLVLLPLLMGAEKIGRDPPRIFVATTSVIVNAPPAAVWEHVIRFGQIEPPTNWLFRTGIAFPIRARIEGAGVGAVRYCEFSTGPFVEPITVWDAPRLLKFDVTHNPPPLKEWSPFFDIHPPHLEDFLKSHGGQFHLIDLGDGRTRLEGTTWYQHTMWPEQYWSWWSDYVIHRIHTRVLEHVKRESEAAFTSSVAALPASERSE